MLLNQSENAVSSQFDVHSGIDEDDEIDYEDTDDRFLVTSSEEDMMMENFYAWLISVDGGLKPLRSATQHKAVVMQALHYLDSSGKNYSLLFDRKHLNSYVSYLELNERKPGTVKTYLNSIKLFFSFVLIVAPDNVPVENGKIAAIKGIVNQWCRNYHKKIGRERYERQLRDLANIPTPIEVCSLDASQHVKSAINMLKLYNSTTHPPNRRDYCLCRDYLLTYLVLDNASRSGCISNMTMKEFNQIECQPDGSYIVTIIEHKTVATSGPAMLSIRHELMTHFQTYVQKLRNRLENIRHDEKAPVFTSWSGKTMATSMVSTQLNKFWQVAINVNFEHRVTAKKSTVKKNDHDSHS